MPRVRFLARNEAYGRVFDAPVSGVKCVPEWFVAADKHSHGEVSFAANGRLDKTVKTCGPTFDAMTAGYVFSLPCDVMVSQLDDGSVDWNWSNTLYAPVELHDKSQLGGMPFDAEYFHDEFVGKFLTMWVPKLPDGYSLLVVHPMWRYDLPFMVLPGIIDYDSYGLGINFFFLLRRGFEGLLRCGTPIGQVMPFKRQNWKSEVGVLGEEEYLVEYDSMRKYMENAYKKLNHSKKVWG